MEEDRLRQRGDLSARKLAELKDFLKQFREEMDRLKGRQMELEDQGDRAADADLPKVEKDQDLFDEMLKKKKENLQALLDEVRIPPTACATKSTSVKFDGFDLLMIEQPLWHDDFYFHSMLQRRLRRPSVSTNPSVTAAMLSLPSRWSCRIINIKLGRVGGFSEAIAVHNAAKERGIPVWCGGMLDSGIGRAHNIALSTLEGFTLPGDVSAAARYWAESFSTRAN